MRYPEYSRLHPGWQTLVAGTMMTESFGVRQTAHVGVMSHSVSSQVSYSAPYRLALPYRGTVWSSNTGLWSRHNEFAAAPLLAYEEPPI